MRMPTSFDGLATRLSPEVRALAASLSLFAGILAFIGSCGSGDLAFPGMIMSTPTSQFTATPVPTATP
jgi:hypothetical protein